MQFIFLLKRYFIILLSSLTLWFLAGLAVFIFYWESNTTFKWKLYLIIAVQDKNSSISANELAANNFWETLIWWFRNPAFLRQITWDVNWDKNWISFSAFKQERQNLVIEVVSKNKETTEKMLRNAYFTLFSNIKKFNQSSDAKYMPIEQWQVFSIYSTNWIIYPLIWMILFLIIIFIFIAIYEFFNWVVSSTKQAEEIIWTKVLDEMSSDFDKNDYTLLWVAIQKMKPVVILAWLNFDIEKLSVLIAQRQSFFWEKMLLIDWDLQKRGLHHALWISSRLKNLKWLTNISEDFIKVNDLEIPLEIQKNNIKTSSEISEITSEITSDFSSENHPKIPSILEKKDNTNLFLQNTLDDNLKFIPAWTWDWFLIEIFHNLSHQMRTLIHTQLPENAEILRLSKATLVLVIKLWESKISDLKRIKEVWGDEIKLVIVK